MGGRRLGTSPTNLPAECRLHRIAFSTLKSLGVDVDDVVAVIRNESVPIIGVGRFWGL